MASLIEENPNLRIPFDHGWRRELVQRATTAADEARGAGGGIRADAYYFSPQGKKLRSIKETETYLREIGSPLDVVCFSFTRHLLGAGPPHERLRKARPVGASAAPATTTAAAPVAGGQVSATAAVLGRKTAAAATAEKKTALAKKIQRNKHTITMGMASSVIKLPSPTTASPQKMPRKHSLMEKSRKAFAFKAMELKKKMPVFQSETSKLKPSSGAVRRPGRPPGSGGGRDRVPMKRPWLLAEVDEQGGVQCRQPPDMTAAGEYFRLVRATATPHTADNVLIGRRRVSQPCSLFCFPEPPLSLPSAQCLICRCLSHPACVGLEDARLTSFVCVDCYTGVGLGRGFDGLGDTVEDSGSGSCSDSDGDSVEELLTGPPPPLPVPPPPLMMGGPRFGAPQQFTPGVKRPRGRPRLLGPRQPRPGAVRGAYARRGGLGIGRGSHGDRVVTIAPRPAGTDLSPASGVLTSPVATGEQTFRVAVPSPSASPATDSPAKKRSWKDP